ncbi:AraC family transcriptional regulator [Paenibacillus albidus]|uniref:AraC family transcriptional regulator n=1 Tax=Paenibacillus albidus TaxID=2041023 RepID=A0A917D5V7_9BACL|nr:AraC family transcriptional regulator [Paenibacillus albidus]GGG10792.1 AraC family transcriptional regulator [Paenibacillus albidus]
MTNPYPEIDGVIAYIHQHIYDPLPLSKLASYAGYSPYHFTRVFKKRIGLPPLYYVSSVRLQKAKDLLLQTDLGIRDIALEIGQQSLGTFTTRFAGRVGATPAEFRNSRLEADNHMNALQRLGEWKGIYPGQLPYNTIQGTVEAEVPFQGVILIGLFARPIPEGFPLYGTLLSELGKFSFSNVKPGTYFLMATSIAWGTAAVDVLLPHRTLRTRSRNPIVVQPYTRVPYQEVRLHVPRLDDPPILISLPLLMNRFLSRMLVKS